MTILHPYAADWHTLHNTAFLQASHPPPPVLPLPHRLSPHRDYAAVGECNAEHTVHERLRDFETSLHDCDCEEEL